jgi:manganese transport protein
MDHETQSDFNNMEQYVDALKLLGYNAVARIGYGARGNAIAGIVNTEKIDFMVMGSHGHKAVKDLIYGTTVDTVRHLVNVPVLVVKAPQK